MYRICASFIRTLIAAYVAFSSLWPAPAQMAQKQAPSSAPAPIESAAIRFANELLEKMTIEEKLGQMSQTDYRTDEGNHVEGEVRKGLVGSVLFIRDPVEVNRLQKIAVEESRLHIPLIIGFDVIHGFRTIYLCHWPCPHLGTQQLLSPLSAWQRGKLLQPGALELRAHGGHYA